MSRYETDRRRARTTTVAIITLIIIIIAISRELKTNTFDDRELTRGVLVI